MGVMAVGDVGSDVGVKRDLETASKGFSQVVALYVKPYRLMSGVAHCLSGLKMLVGGGEAGR